MNSLKMDNLKAIIGVPEDKEDFVIEIYIDDNYGATLAEIERLPLPATNQDNSLEAEQKFFLKIYNNPHRDSWNIDLNQLYEILTKAEQELEA